MARTTKENKSKTKQNNHSNDTKSTTPRTYDKKSLNWALGQEFLKAYMRIPHIRARFGVQKRVILDPRFLLE